MRQFHSPHTVNYCATKHKISCHLCAFGCHLLAMSANNALFLSRHFRNYQKYPSKTCCHWESVIHSFLVPNPVWGTWPEISFCLRVTGLPMTKFSSCRKHRFQHLNHSHVFVVTETCLSTFPVAVHQVLSHVRSAAAQQRHTLTLIMLEYIRKQEWQIFKARR